MIVVERRFPSEVLFLVRGLSEVHAAHEIVFDPQNLEMVGTGRFELPTPRTPSECSTRLSHVPTRKEPAASYPQRLGLTHGFYHLLGSLVRPRWILSKDGRAKE